MRRQPGILGNEIEGPSDNPEFVKTHFIARRLSGRSATRHKAKENGQLQPASQA